jgi:hypothetical protein
VPSCDTQAWGFNPPGYQRPLFAVVNESGKPLADDLDWQVQQVCKGMNATREVAAGGYGANDGIGFNRDLVDRLEPAVRLLAAE